MKVENLDYEKVKETFEATFKTIKKEYSSRIIINLKDILTILKGLKEAKESWDEFDDEHEFYPSTVLFNAKTRKGNIDQDVDDALSIRNGQKYWNKKELSNRDKMMKKYIDGSRDEYDIEDAWDGIHY